jgi:CheY-like chemotaxis protein
MELGGMSSESAEFDQSERHLHVLLAEDHPTNRMVVELILGSSGVEVTSVEDGQKAVDRFKTEHFDAVIMDVQMPIMDGLTAIREIRAHEAESGVERTPVHVLSTNALPQDFAASIEAGADSHLTKPVNANALLTTVMIGKVA